VERGLRGTNWPTAHELAKELRLSDSTVRGHLYDLLIEGLAARKCDPAVPSPRGGGADRWTWLAVPIGPPTETSLMLCDSCAQEEFGDQMRYRQALGAGELQRYIGMICDEGDSEVPVHHCERCRGPLMPLVAVSEDHGA
jgi:hypothetical protein